MTLATLKVTNDLSVINDVELEVGDIERQLFLAYALDTDSQATLASINFDLGEPALNLVASGELESHTVEILRERESYYLYWDDFLSGYGIEGYLWE